MPPAETVKFNLCRVVRGGSLNNGTVYFKGLFYLFDTVVSLKLIAVFFVVRIGIGSAK